MAFPVRLSTWVEIRVGRYDNQIARISYQTTAFINAPGL